MLNNIKKSAGFFFFCIIAISLTAYRWREWIYLPSHYVVEPYGDGIKSYLVPLFHIKHDSTYNHYEGMNFPYGENIVAADGMSTLSFPLKWLFNKGIDLTPYWPKIVHITLLISFLTGIFFLFKIGVFLGIPYILSGSIAIVVAFLSPQLLRMEAHLGLAHLAFIPAMIYYWLAYSRHPYFKSIFPLIPLTFIAAGIHFYYVAFILSFSLIFLFFWYLFPVKKPPLPLFMLHVGGAVIFPFVVLYQWVNGGDQPTDRCPQPWGFFQYNAIPDGLLFSPDNPFWRWVDRHIFPIHWENFADIERYNYLGLSFLFFLCILFLILIVPKERKYLIQTFSKKDAGVLALLFSTTALLLLSFGLPFVIKGLEGLLTWTGPFRQFRSVGRFSWVFYYAIHIFLSLALFRFFKEKKLAVPVWGIYFTLMAIDLTHFHRRLNVGLEPIAELEIDRKTTFWTGIHAENFQSILTLPYFNLGSDQFWLEPEGFILQKSLLFSAKTGLPTNSAMLTRSSRSQTYNQLQWMSETYRYPLVLNELNSRQPFLLMVDKIFLENERGKRYMHLLKYASIIHDEERLALYSLPYHSFEKLMKDKYSEIKNLGASLDKNNHGTYTSIDKVPYLFNGWNKNMDRSANYDGGSGKKLALNKKEILYQGKLPENGKPGTWIISIWINIKEDKRSTSQFTIAEKTRNGREFIQVFPAHSYFRVFDVQGWALAEIPWVLNAEGSQLTIQVQNGDIPSSSLLLDELLIRPENAVLIKKDDRFIWLNNRRFPVFID